MCWPSAGAGPADRGRRGTEAGRMAGQSHATGDRIVELLEQADGHCVRVVGQVGRGGEHAARHPLGLEPRHRLGGGQPSGGRVDALHDVTRRPHGSSCGRPWWPPRDRRSRRRPAPGRCRRSRRPTSAWRCPSRRRTRIGSKPATRLDGMLPSASISTSLPAASTHRNDTTASSIDSSTCWPPAPRSRANSAAVMAWTAVSAVTLSAAVWRRKTGRAVGSGLGVGQPGVGLDHGVVGRLAGVGTGRAEARERHVDELGVAPPAGRRSRGRPGRPRPAGSSGSARRPAPRGAARRRPRRACGCRPRSTACPGCSSRTAR